MEVLELPAPHPSRVAEQPRLGSGSDGTILQLDRGAHSLRGACLPSASMTREMWSEETSANMTREY